MNDIQIDAEEQPHKKRKISNGDAKKMAWAKNEDCYFDSYANIELHRTMIEDQVRTDCYRKAIFAEKNWLKDKVVADVGCGTGILSMFCAQAGAKKVYAIDASQIAVHAEQLVKENHYADVITVIKGRAEDIELPEKVDAIVSEWMGYMLLFESMLPSVLHIRDKYLKPGGKMFPEKAAIYLGLGDSTWLRQYQEHIYDFWISLQHNYGLDMSSLADAEVEKYTNCAQVHMVPQEDVISRSSKICTFDLLTIQPNAAVEVSSKFTFQSMGSRLMNCLVMWFDVSFPDGSVLTTSPDHECTHWQNTMLPLNEIAVKQDTLVEGTISIVQKPSYYRYLNITIDFYIDGGRRVSKIFTMDDQDNE